MKDTRTTIMTARKPISPMAALRSVTIGSLSLPDMTSAKSGMDRMKARHTQQAAAPPM
jgi:hypothetical protein